MLRFNGPENLRALSLVARKPLVQAYKSISLLEIGAISAIGDTRHAAKDPAFWYF
ncbi:MAG TPA: hypothetical protein VGA56_15475 [Opitutaceae bacterium]